MKNIVFLILVITAQVAKGQNNEMLVDLNPHKLNLNFSEYDQSTAAFLGQVAELSYWKSEDLKRLHTRMVKLYPDQNINYTLIYLPSTNTQVVLWGCKNYLVISFRGTQFWKLKDWISDAKFWRYEFSNEDAQKRYAGLPSGSAGARKAIMTLMDSNFFKTLNDQIIKSCGTLNKKLPVFVTGHSLGASLAQIFCVPLANLGYNYLGSYHFAPPFTISHTDTAEMNRRYGAITYNIVNYKDIVPRLRSVSKGRIGKFYRICDDGDIYREKDILFRFSLLRGLEVRKEFYYHSLGNHINAIKKNSNNNSLIKNRSEGRGDSPCMQPLIDSH
ncbi:MAG: hypothetical protein V4590_07315 [Bacteroidota bacterium]